MRAFVLFFSTLVLFITACNLEVNKSVRLKNGEKHSDDIVTVNGSIITGKNCQVGGTCNSINGKIEIGEGSTVKDLQTVNGKIFIAENVTVEGEIEAINGNITIRSGSVVLKDISAVNGRIDITETHVKQDILVKNDDLFIRQNSIVEGNIFVDSKGMMDSEKSQRRSITIKILDGSVVKGNLEVGDTGIQATVYLADGGKILGEVRNAEVIDRNNK